MQSQITLSLNQNPNVSMCNKFYRSRVSWRQSGQTHLTMAASHSILIQCIINLTLNNASDEQQRGNPDSCHFQLLHMYLRLNDERLINRFRKLMRCLNGTRLFPKWVTSWCARVELLADWWRGNAGVGRRERGMYGWDLYSDLEKAANDVQSGDVWMKFNTWESG